jgi:hypothetical protein
MNTEKNSIADAISALKEEAARNDEFAAIMYVLANRERTRRNLDLVALQRTMEQHGADFKRETYEHAISKLGALGFGRVKRSPGGKILGLTDINTTLQSIGQASAGKVDKLEQFKAKKLNKFKKLPDIAEKIMEETPNAKRPGLSESEWANLKPAKTAYEKPAITKPKSRAYSLFLTVMINSSPVVFPGPANMKPEDLGAFLLNFNNLVKGYGGNA